MGQRRIGLCQRMDTQVAPETFFGSCRQQGGELDAVGRGSTWGSGREASHEGNAGAQEQPECAEAQRLHSMVQCGAREDRRADSLCGLNMGGT